MRLLQVNNYADPIGGAEVYALALTRELRARGHEVAFFGTAPDREVTEEGLRIVQRPRYDARVLFADPTVAGALDETLTRFRPELVHLHNVFSLGADVLLRLRARGVPIVQTVHDYGLLCPNSWCVWPDGTPCSGGAGAKCFEHGCEQNYPFDADVALHTWLKQRLLAEAVDLSICPSAHLADLMREHGSRRVVHLGYFIDPIASPAGLERGTRQLLFVGRLQPEKGVEHLIDAMPLVLQAFPETSLTVVGGGVLASELKARAERLGLGGSVTFLDHVPREQLGRFHATATACVLPSIWTENSPLVAYECLTAGLPMIGSRIGGIPELVVDGESGFTFVPRDPADLARSVLRLFALSDDARAAMSRRMRERARAFAAAEHVDRLEGHYAEARGARAVGTLPADAMDGDLMALLARSSREKERLAGLFLEHVAHIRHLEEALAARAGTVPRASGGDGREASLSDGARTLLGRVARMLRTAWKAPDAERS